MPIKCLNFYKIQNKSNPCAILFLFIASCSYLLPSSYHEIELKGITTYCTKEDKQKSRFEFGDIICPRDELKHKSERVLKIDYVITHKDSDDPYEYGYPILNYFKGNSLVETIKLRKKDDAYSSEIPFVRIRKQQYFADLDNDGHDEFAIMLFHPGSNPYLPVRIFSLKKQITFWGKGKIHFESDGHVLLNCPDECSKFDPQACDKCE